MARGLRRWIPNLGVLGLKPLGSSKVTSAFHPSVEQLSTRNFLGTECLKVNCLLVVAL